MGGVQDIIICSFAASVVVKFTRSGPAVDCNNLHPLISVSPTGALEVITKGRPQLTRVPFKRQNRLYALGVLLTPYLVRTGYRLAFVAQLVLCATLSVAHAADKKG